MIASPEMSRAPAMVEKRLVQSRPLRVPAARSKNERVELEMKILRYRKLARQMATNPDTAQRIKELIADLEKELREIDE